MSKTQKPDVGSSFPLATVIALTFGVLIVVCGVLAWRHFSNEKDERTVRIATGAKGGIYYELGHALCRLLEEEGVVAEAIPLDTGGSADNMQLLHDSKADLAFVQSDLASGTNIGLVASLYDEVLHIMMRPEVASQLTTLEKLQGFRVSLGAPGSGTRLVAQRILDHFNVTLNKEQPLSATDAGNALHEEKLDAAFVLSALPSPAVRTLCDMDNIQFLSLGIEHGRADAVARVFPSYRSTTIPVGTYGIEPSAPIRTISVAALLVAATSADPDLVRDIAGAMFRHRLRLAEQGDKLAIAKRIRESYSPDVWMIPYHEGAVAYYERDEPPFMVEYAEAISLLLTLMVGMFSGSIAFRGWLRRRRKNRIDSYYNEVRGCSSRLGSASHDELQGYADQLLDIRQRAFEDLVLERLDANESFSIFQDYLRSELMAIETRLSQVSG